MESLFQNLKEWPVLVAESRYKAAHSSYTPSQTLNSLVFEGGCMSSTTFILSGFASIPQPLTMKPKNFSAETPKAHLVRFNFML